jgi:hypothetical protein
VSGIDSLPSSDWREERLDRECVSLDIPAAILSVTLTLDEERGYHSPRVARLQSLPLKSHPLQPLPLNSHLSHLSLESSTSTYYGMIYAYVAMIVM